MSVTCLYTIFPVLQYDSIETRRARSLQALALYFNEDPEELVKEYGVSVISYISSTFSAKYALINVFIFYLTDLTY